MGGGQAVRRFWDGHRPGVLLLLNEAAITQKISQLITKLLLFF